MPAESNAEPVSVHTAAKLAMTAAAVATRAGDPRAVELTERALEALRAAEGSPWR